MMARDIISCVHHRIPHLSSRSADSISLANFSSIPSRSYNIMTWRCDYTANKH